MFTPHSLGVALIMMITSAICWGSWANTYKGVKNYRFELFYWSNVKGRWTTFGNLGRMKLMLESAHEIVDSDPMFRIPRGR